MLIFIILNMAFGLLYDYLMGTCIDAYKYFGAHFVKLDNIDGVIFRLYAPQAEDVSVIGDWNNWDVTKNKLSKIDDCGVWEGFVPNVFEYQKYKFHFKNAKGVYVDKIDPFAFFSELRPGTCSKIFSYEGYPWHDFDYMRSRTRNFDNAMSIYEMHLGSWYGTEGADELSYEELARKLVNYLLENHFTHVEIMPIIQHPFDGSWGYQGTGFFSVDSRYGNPKQLMYLIDTLHLANIGVILDFAPVHFASDSWGLFDYDGAHEFEPNNEKRMFSPWGSAYFDLGKDPVRSFLMSSMNYFINEFHFDGLRIDAVSNILFYDGNKELGTNNDGVEFLKRLNSLLHNAHSSLMTIAEDSTDFYGVTKPLEFGGIGFDYKWDLGWMNDTLKYYSLDPIYKKFEHNKFTFSMAYFFNENFLLPLSHDEVVHGKGTIINKMWGDYETKFALLRNLYLYQFAHPGKILNFMGNELASFDEWNENKSLPWELKRFPKHDSISRLFNDLNTLYLQEKCMRIQEYNPNNFRWTMVDNAQDSVFAFERCFEDSSLLFVFNMTPNFYEHYVIGVSKDGVYEEIINTDKDIYGGRNNYNGLPLWASSFGPYNQPYKIDIKLGAFAAMIFRRKN